MSSTEEGRWSDPISMFTRRRQTDPRPHPSSQNQTFCRACAHRRRPSAKELIFGASQTKPTAEPTQTLGGQSGQCCCGCEGEERRPVKRGRWEFERFSVGRREKQTGGRAWGWTASNIWVSGGKILPASPQKSI